MILERFDPPGHLNDMDGIPSQLEAWDEMISFSFDRSVESVEQAVGAGNSQYYNPKRVETAEPFDTAEITWNGFPLTLTRIHGDQAALQVADHLENLNQTGLFHRRQDEYCEWFTEREPATDKIIRATFTCEGPEYWKSLADGYPSNYEGPRDAGATGDKDKLLSLYRELVSPQVQLEDLLFSTGSFAGQYNRWNKWNTTDGIAHLTHPANTLRAEIQLGADATIRRQKGGQDVTDADALICCAAFGGVNRSSDPTIGSQVNALARLGASITLKNPVGLYMDGLDVSGWTKPDGTPVDDYWKIVRGKPGQILRAVYEVPESEGFVVGDIRIGGVPIEFAGQIARRITVKLTGVACRVGQSQVAAVPCVRKCCRSASNPSVLEIRRPNAPCQDVHGPQPVSPVLVGAAHPELAPDSRGPTELD